MSCSWPPEKVTLEKVLLYLLSALPPNFSLNAWLGIRYPEVESGSAKPKALPFKSSSVFVRGVGFDDHHRVIAARLIFVVHGDADDIHRFRIIEINRGVGGGDMLSTTSTLPPSRPRITPE